MQELLIAQLNMHRAYAAVHAIQEKVATKPTICLVTEPCTAFEESVQDTTLFNPMC